MDMSHGERRRFSTPRCRALIGCTAIAVMVSLGLPGLTAMAADEPPPTAPSVELADGAETTVPDTTVPDTTVPETTVPETTAPATTAPATSVPETTVAETTVPETTVTETTVPDTTVPETTVPDTTVPDTTVAETTVADTTVAETTLPETTVPDMTVPEETEVATGGTDTTAPTTTASTSTAPTTTALGAEAASVSVLAVVPQVSGVRATQSVDDQGFVKHRIVTISWSGTPDAEYEVERRLSTSSTWQGLGLEGSTSVRDAFVEGRTFGSYQYRVTPKIWYPTGYVYGSPGYVSVNVTRVAYPPSLPRSVRVTRTTTTAQVTWTAPTTTDYDCESTGYYICDPATSYIVSWGPAGGTWQRVTTTGTSRTISVAQLATTYHVRVFAVNAAGRSGGTTSVAIAALPKPSVRATAGNRQVVLRWTAPANNGSPITRYVIQRRSAASTTWTYLSTTTPAAAATSFTARNLVNGTVYYFRIAAVNASGVGPWSAAVGATPRTVP
jgi:hypothetical protein